MTQQTATPSAALHLSPEDADGWGYFFSVTPAQLRVASVLG
jgi:hypothetical protein